MKLNFLGVVRNLRHAEKGFFTNFPSNKKFCFWTVTNPLLPPPLKAWHNLLTTPYSSTP